MCRDQMVFPGSLSLHGSKATAHFSDALFHRWQFLVLFWLPFHATNFIIIFWLMPSMLPFLFRKKYVSRNRLSFTVLPFNFKRYDRLQLNICEGLAILCRNYGIRCDGLWKESKFLPTSQIDAPQKNNAPFREIKRKCSFLFPMWYIIFRRIELWLEVWKVCF